jgi:1-acyl-sn-glycerol-3-phosphate acyltransferase
MHNFLVTIHTFANKYKFLSFGILFSMLLVFGFFASRITFQENINQLIPSNDQSSVTSKVLDQVNFADKIAIIITSKENGSPEDLTQYANVFLDSVNASCAPYIGKIQGKIADENIQETFDFVNANLPLFLDKADYATIQNKIKKDSIAEIVEGNYKTLISPTGIVSKDFILQDPLGISFIALKKLQQLAVGDDFQLHNGFVTTKDKKNILLFITPKLSANETDKNTVFIQKLNAIKESLNIRFVDKVAMNYFGSTPVAVANATQIKSDVQNTAIFATISLMLILIYFYRSVLTPIIIFIPSIFGALFALAVLYFWKGTISAISLGISSILLGETTDYSIYVLTHLRNNKNVKLLYKDITKPLLLCGITTAITFLCLFFIKSEALKDLGIFASLSVISTTLFSLVLIPLLYRTKNKVLIPKSNIIDKLGFYSYHKSKFLVGSVLALLVISFFTYSKVTFNNDLSAINFMTPELKNAEKELENITVDSSKSIYLASYGKSYEEVLNNNSILFTALEKEKNTSQIQNFSSIGGIVFSEAMQKQKIQQWNTFWSTQKKSELKNQLISNGNTFGFKASSFSKFYDTLDKEFEPIPFGEYAKVKSFFLEEFIAEKNGFYTVSTLVKVAINKRDAFVNKIKKQENIVVIDRQETNETFLGTLKTNFEDLVNYSFIAVFFILVFAFRKMELVIISIIPIMISWIFTTGIMGMFGLQFNVVNIIVCTLIFGIGVDYSIFMTSALQKEHTFGTKQLGSYRTSILLSVATTLLGIGVLVFAKHPALKSISMISVIGIFSALVITFILQPLVFNFFVTSRVKKGQPPFEIKRLLHSILSFTYYGLGGFLLSIIGAVLIKIIPFSKRKKVKVFHFVMSKFMQSVLMSYPSIRRRIINIQNEKFEKPAVIIANHSSFLDILAVGMLSPKIIFLVSDWVYNSPIFGRGVRLAGFYPVSSGIDNGVEHLRAKVEQGFSLMVFPEGTRSVDNSIKRFHKGAFFLAEEFQLDIIPVVIHGYSEVLPKGDFVINGGKTTVEILKRIAPDNIDFGKDYAARTKKVSVFFKEHYRNMRRDLEDQNYFKKMILNSFDYKETEVIGAVKNDLNQYLEQYHKLNSYIDSKSKVLHYANDYGQLDVLLTLQESQRKIVSFIQDEEKRAVAKTNYILKKRNIQYIENIAETSENNYDVILISDENLENIEEITKLADCIILINNARLKDSIINFGFKVDGGEDQLIILRKDVG